MLACQLRGPDRSRANKKSLQRDKSLGPAVDHWTHSPPKFGPARSGRLMMAPTPAPAAAPSGTPNSTPCRGTDVEQRHTAHTGLLGIRHDHGPVRHPCPGEPLRTGRAESSSRSFRSRAPSDQHVLARGFWNASAYADVRMPPRCPGCGLSCRIHAAAQVASFWSRSPRPRFHS